MADPDHDLLFALIALRSDRITPPELLAAVADRGPAAGPPLGDLLLGRGVLTGADVEAIEREMANPEDPTVGESWTTIAESGTGADPATQLDPLGTRTAGLAEGDDPFATRASPPATLAAAWAGWAGEPPNFGELAARARRFHRMRLLARGGLGAVFVAHDAELHRDVALKEILERQADDPDSRCRFLREAEITGSLEHPGIVPVYGLGLYSDGRPYYAMRLIQGTTLGEAVRAHHEAERPGRDPGERLLGLRKLLGQFLEVCNALGYAHSKGVIHRDIKPGNVMLGRFGETLLVDWGLAKRVGRDEPGDEPPAGSWVGVASCPGTVETVRGASFGTPHFMSPEQAGGDVDRVGPASDIYSLGATLYVLLTGRLPFEGRGFHAILEGTIAGDFPPPRQANRLVHPALEAVCLKAMSLEPAARYPSARAMADDLERWLADEPIAAWREPASVRARRWVKVHRTAVTSAGAAVLVAAVGLAYALHGHRLREAEHRARASGWVGTLIKADLAELPQVLEQAIPDRTWIVPALARRADDHAKSERARLHIALALVALDPSRLDDRLGPLSEAMLRADPAQLPVIRDALSPRAATLVPRLWRILEDARANPSRRFDAACALATYDPPRSEAARARWAPFGPFVVGRAVDEVAFNTAWCTALKGTLGPAADVLFEPLLAIFRDRDPAASDRRSIAVNFLNSYARRTDQVVELLLDADAAERADYLDRLRPDRDVAVVLLDREARRAPDPPSEVAPADPSDRRARARQERAQRRGRAGVALLLLGAADRAWPLLRHSPDPGVRSEMIQGLARSGVAPEALIARLGAEPDVSSRRALILALGEYPPARVAEPERLRLVEDLAARFRSEGDPGLHSAIDWLLRVRWGEGARIRAIEAGLAGAPPPSGRDWYVDGQGQTLAILRGPVAGVVGSPDLEPARGPMEVRHPARVDRTVAIGTREVTAREYARFLGDNPDLAPLNPVGHLPPDGPMLSVSFFDAIRYCNWLSAREGIPEAEWCYPAGARRGMALPAGYLDRTGFRLPTQVEWELACRAGASTARPFGDSEAMADQYAWTRQNSGSRPHLVAQLRPNDLGLFDVLGNAWEWTMDVGSPYATAPDGPPPAEDPGPVLSEDAARVLRGGSFDYGPEMARCAAQPGLTPSSRFYTLGFRVARTLATPGKAR